MDEAGQSSNGNVDQCKVIIDKGKGIVGYKDSDIFDVSYYYEDDHVTYADFLFDDENQSPIEVSTYENHSLQEVNDINHVVAETYRNVFDDIDDDFVPGPTLAENGRMTKSDVSESLVSRLIREDKLRMGALHPIRTRDGRTREWLQEMEKYKNNRRPFIDPSPPPHKDEQPDNPSSSTTITTTLPPLLPPQPKLCCPQQDSKNQN